MKKYHLLFILLILLLLNSCSIFSQSKVKPVCKPIIIEKPVYIKCKIPNIPEQKYEKIPKNATYPQKLQIILNNYLKMQKEIKMLREAIKSCQ